MLDHILNSLNNKQIKKPFCAIKYQFCLLASSILTLTAKWYLENKHVI